MTGRPRPPDPDAVASVAFHLRRLERDLRAATVSAPALRVCRMTLGLLPPCRAEPWELEARDVDALLDARDRVAGYGVWLGRVAAARLSHSDGAPIDCRGIPRLDALLPGVHLDAEDRLPALVVPVDGARIAHADGLLAAGDAPPEATWRLDGDCVTLPTVDFRSIARREDAASRAHAEFAAVSLELAWHLGALGHAVDTVFRAVGAYLSAFWSWQEDSGKALTAAKPVFDRAVALEEALRAAIASPRASGIRYARPLRRGDDHLAQVTDPAKRLSRARQRLFERLSAAGHVGSDTPATDPSTVTAQAPPRERRRRPGARITTTGGHTPATAVVSPRTVEEPAVVEDARRLFGERLAADPEVAAWLEAARLYTATATSGSGDSASPDPVVEDMARSHLSLFSSLAAREPDVAAALAELGAEHLDLVVIPGLDVEGGRAIDRLDPGLALAVDWSASRVVELPDKERGHLETVDAHGIRWRQAIVSPARVTLASGPRPPIQKVAASLREVAADVPWVAELATSIAHDAEAFDAWFMEAREDFFEAKARERKLAAQWLFDLEELIGTDPDHASAVFSVHRSLLDRSFALSSERAPAWLDSARFRADTGVGRASARFVYRDGHEAGEVIGVLRDRSNRAFPYRPVVCRAPSPPAWLEPARKLLEYGEPALGPLARSLRDSFEKSLRRDGDFGSPAWQVGLATRIVEGARFGAPGSGKFVEDLREALAAFRPDGALQLVPARQEATAEEERSLLAHAGSGAMSWFSDSQPEGSLLRVTRPGLFERRDGLPTWHVEPHVEASAGAHPELARALQPPLLAAYDWLVAADIPPGKRSWIERRFRDDVHWRFLEVCRSAGSTEPARAARDLLTGRRGLVALLCIAGGGSDGPWSAIEELAGQHGLLAEDGDASDVVRSHRGGSDQVVALLPGFTEGDPAVVRLRGGAERPTALDLGLGLLEAIARHDEIDPDGAEANALLDTVRGLTKPDANVVLTLSYLVTKVYALAHGRSTGAAVSSASALEHLHRLRDWGRRLLQEHDITTEELDPGVDLRLHEGRFTSSGGSSGWSVVRTRRPCLVQGDRVLQVGIVDTA